jgi:hypothetical protein
VTDPVTSTRGPSFGIMTAPSQVGYQDVLRVWREADRIPQIEHAWLFDHLMPLGGDPNGPTFEGSPSEFRGDAPSPIRPAWKSHAPAPAAAGTTPI